ncbi:MAG: alanine racemase [Dehalococcoidia bacterium]|jgi:D-serine deaminase-like pyridoxal phosphate-dependent protein|nr:alanine racemase [Dehalococcoidia bacterium]
MERPIFQPVGTPMEELDTPALVVDLEVMERNIETLHSYFRQADAKVRPHVASHQCPQIAHRQLAAGGTVEGIAVTTAGEAEVFSNAGFTDILVANQIVTRPKIRRLCALAGLNRVTVAVDNPRNVDALSAGAMAAGVTLNVLVEVEAGLGRCGVLPGTAVLDLARAVDRSPGLAFAGLMAIPPAPLPPQGENGEFTPPDRATLEAETRNRLQPVLDTRSLIEANGLPVRVVSVGGTHNYDIAGGMSGVTEVQAGSYPLMDFSYCRVRTEFTPAARVLAQVISHPVGHLAVVDAGHKATGPDHGMAVLDGEPGASAVRFSAEHGILDLKGLAIHRFQPGATVWLVPQDLRLCLNQYDYIRAVRGGKLEGFWPMSSRGRFD